MKLFEKSGFYKGFLLIITFVVYSCSTIFSKMASDYSTFSMPYLMWFSGVVAVLGLYAVLWQKILSIMELSKAYLCKSISITIILGLSYFVFEPRHHGRRAYAGHQRRGIRHPADAVGLGSHLGQRR